MRKLLSWIEAVFAAVAFAEEGEVETARQVMADADRDDGAARGAPGSKAARGPARPRSIPHEKIARLS